MIKTIKYTYSNVGRNPSKPYVDISEEDQAWIYTETIRVFALMGSLNQADDIETFAVFIKQRPAVFPKGKKEPGPNSVFSMLAGILNNYTQNAGKYPSGYRLTLTQLQAVEAAFDFVSKVDDTFPRIQLQLGLSFS